MLSFLYDILGIGGYMKIGIDKFCIDKIDQSYDYVYLFDNTEDLDDLLKTNLHCINYKECEFVDINLSKYDVECYKKANIKDKDCYILPEFKENKIAIIIPNFNYEHTIEKCLTSILNQTYKNYEVIFVDDVSTDNSVKIASTFKKKMNIKIIELKQKRYNGGSRNEAYLHLSDDVDYIWYIDSDDWLEDENVLDDINKKLQTRPDVVFVGMSEYKNGIETLYATPEYKDKYEAFKGWSGSCGKVIKKSLAIRPECLYNEGTLKEDRNQHRRICYYMKDFKLLKRPVYVWNRENYKSVTTIRDKVMWGTSTIRHYADTLQFALSIEGQDKEIDKILKASLEQQKDELKSGGDRQW